ncbi:Winged helix-turn-helix transcription repressor DNA-binding [Penicillium sp. IBT 16267x]|nr:Winged helix-turn-helix transcription repressor DNA-binding [Penicillium sp. IBT 16267x]
MELEDAMKLEDSDGTTLSIPTAPPSPISITSHHSSSHSSDSVHSNPISIMTDNSSPRPSSGDSEEDHPADPPYSQLIYQALREAKGHRLQLQDIYAWFEKNTNKGKDQGKGWQNSIRHNLSMNAGFEAIKTDVPGGKRALNYWSLTAQAISKGRVESTTRYRRPTPKKGLVSQRGNAKVQKSWDETRQPKNQKHRPTTKSPSQQLVYARVGQGEPVPPYQIPPVSTASHMQICPYAFDYDRVVACTPSSHGNGNSPMFYDNVDPAPSWELVGMDNYEWLSGLNNGAGSGSEGQLRMHGHVKEKRWG